MKEMGSVRRLGIIAALVSPLELQTAVLARLGSEGASG
jgi:hypothetical protein